MRTSKIEKASRIGSSSTFWKRSTRCELSALIASILSVFSALRPDSPSSSWHAVLTILEKLDDDHRAIHANGDALAENVIMDLVTDEHTQLAVLLLICTLILRHEPRHDLRSCDVLTSERGRLSKTRFVETCCGNFAPT